ncbi:hypothetical protein BH11PAT3_BH11PAT3_2290 [soil metagenome]
MRFELTPQRGLWFILFLLLITYSLFQGRFVILGPSIHITYPQDGTRLDTQVYMLSGVAKNIAYISLNDRQIFVDQEGNFSEKLIAPPGLSIIMVRARDRFGRQEEQTVRVVYNN